MKLQLQHNNTTYSFETETDDVILTDFMQLVEDMLLVSGYSKQGIEEYIIEWGKELENKKG